MIKIRKAMKKDFEKYYGLKKEEEKEYPIVIGEKIKFPSKKELMKEFSGFVIGKNKISYVAFYDDNLIAYTNFIINKTIWSKTIFIEDLFVKKDFRRNGIATKLIKEVINFSKKNKINKIFLSVIIKNVHAVELYKKLGFKVNRYDMEKKLK